MKVLTIVVLVLALLVSSCAFVTYSFLYYKYTLVDSDGEKIADYFKSRLKPEYVHNPVTNEDILIGQGAYRDSINAALKPFVVIHGGAGYDINPETDYFGVEPNLTLNEIALLNKLGFLGRFNVSSPTKELAPPSELWAMYGRNGEIYGLYANVIKSDCGIAALCSAANMVAAGILLWTSLVAIKSSYYDEDLVFMRYPFMNGTKLWLRRLLSIVLNSALFCTCLGAVIMPFAFYGEVFEPISLYSSSHFYFPILGGFISFLFAFWVFTSLFWWVLGRK